MIKIGVSSWNMDEEFHCPKGPADWSIIYSVVTGTTIKSAQVGYYLDQTGRCYGHGLFHAAMFFSGEALETKLHEINPRIQNLQALITNSGLGTKNQEKARMIMALRHLHAHPSLRSQTAELVKKAKKYCGEKQD